jgi:ubiquinone/menaquinone biosynthesis C-methylase UbiE
MLSREKLLEKYAVFDCKPRVDPDHFRAEINRVLVGIKKDDGSWWRNHNGQIIDKLQPGGGQCAIDVGSGFGNHTSQLRDRYATVIGLDQCQERIDYARKTFGRPGLMFLLADVGAANAFPKMNVDLVHTSTVLQHMDLPGRLEAILSAYKALRPGGHLYMYEGRFTRADKPESREHHMFCTPMSLFEDIFGNFTDHDGCRYSCQKVAE